ncbi:MAG: Diaminopimelate decarboxylase, LysA [Candidatus Methanohalarchaeum thermophilum]|uniref:Diaminopimelate decarboxylase n=1 Tax=Methanohalarchaeum thermophilum TaxID=1903181 RepID=A0A1Q6DU27_METT1|nr:MAG: Diaminopimelate decarboxylase, LysA [Candidatus Methanohalarchaeum thermophilum]
MNRNHLSVSDHLNVEDVDCTRLAEKYKTPLYVTSKKALKNNFNELKEALDNTYSNNRIHYACKANTNISILKTLRKEGSYIDAVSVGEVYLALKSGYEPSEILFTGTSVSNKELEYLVEKDVKINIDSISQLERLSKIGSPEISIRLNPGVGAGHHDHCITGGKESKFGIWEDKIVKAYEKAQRLDFDIKGIHMHIGSGIRDVNKFISPMERMMDIAGKVSNEIGIEFEFIDIGGGLGIPYKPNETSLNLKGYSEEITSIFKSKIEEHGLGNPTLALEPGRFLVGDTTILLTKVNDKKSNPFHKFIGVDAGFNTLLRPAMYGSHHGVINATNPKNAGRYIDGAKETEINKKVDIAGPLCESGDLLAEDRPIKAKIGDYLAILDVGAYGYVMSSRYNSRPLPAEVMVEGNKSKLIRKRETLEDLLNNQVD